MKFLKLILILSLCFFSCKQEKKEAKISDNVEVKIITQKLDNIILSSGTIHRIESFPSKYVQPRNVDVWLPDNYSKDKKYSVLYMHDGQMLFDATTTWNKQEWMVDEIASKLMNDGITKDFIVVAMWNISEIRWQDYYPEKSFNYLSESTKDSVIEVAKKNNFEIKFNADNYLKFITNEVKPYIDSNFSVLTDRENTFISGSSMGGLISMYAMFEYSDIFGGAACISTHWPGTTPTPNNPLTETIFKYIESKSIDAKKHKFYFDFGTKTLDQYYPQYEERVNQIFASKGFDETNFRNLKFEGADHSENSWQKRLDIPLTFLLKK